MGACSPSRTWLRRCRTRALRLATAFSGLAPTFAVFGIFRLLAGASDAGRPGQLFAGYALARR